MENEKSTSIAEESQRKHIRHKVRVKTLVSVGKFRPFWTNLAEISESGLSLESETSIVGLLKTGGDIVILFLLPNQILSDQVRVEVSCRLVHEYFSSGQFRCGLSMIDFKSGKYEMVRYLLKIVE